MIAKYTYDFHGDCVGEFEETDAFVAMLTGYL